MQEPDRPQPLYSSLVDDPLCSEAIDEFVIGVAERIDHLQDADSKGDLRELSQLASQLVVDARSAGYDSLADIAAAVEAACEERASRRAHEGVVELTDLTLRVRLGHRGAMA